MPETNVNKPAHYKGDAVMCAIEEFMENPSDFRIGNVTKYILRHKEKGGHQDLLKAMWYIRRELMMEHGYSWKQIQEELGDADADD